MNIKSRSLLSFATLTSFCFSVSCSNLNEEANNREGKSENTLSSDNSQVANDGGFQLMQPDLGDLKDALKVHIVVQEYVHCAEAPVPLDDSKSMSVALTSEEEDTLVACETNQGRIISDVTMAYEPKKLMRLKVPKGDYLVTLEVLGKNDHVILSGKTKAVVDAEGNGKAHIELSRAKGEGSLVISASIVRELPFCKFAKIVRPSRCIPGRSAQCYVTLLKSKEGPAVPVGSGEVISGEAQCNVYKARLSLYQKLCESETPRDQISQVECIQSIEGNPGNSGDAGGNGGAGSGAPDSMQK